MSGALRARQTVLSRAAVQAWLSRNAPAVANSRGALRGWLAREERRHVRRPQLLSALVSGRGGEYARQRLGFVVLRLLMRTALHGLEVMFLSRVLPFEYLAPLLTYRALAALATNLHWGACEELRSRVRECVREHQPGRARRSVEAWLGSCSRAASIPVALMLLHISVGRPFSISLFDAYALACAVRLLFDVYARTYHAGVFAVRRVYRPLGTLLCADLLEVSLILFGFDALGAWCIPLSIIAGGALDATLGIYYARAAYRSHRLLEPRLTRALRDWPPLRLDVLRRATVQALAGAGLQLDALLLLLLVRVDPPRAGAPSWALIYYVLRPLLGLATQWVRTFYFDLTRIEAGTLRMFRPRLSRMLHKLAWVCAFVGVVCTLAIARLLWPDLATLSLLWLAPLFVTRSLFALAQLQAFTRGRLHALLGASAALGAGLGVLYRFAHTGPAVLCGASLSLALGFWLLRERHHAANIVENTATVLGSAEWLASLRVSGPVRIAVLRIARSSADVGRVMEALSMRHPELRLARHARGHLLLMAAAEHMPACEQLIAGGGGALSHVWLSPTCQGADSIGVARAACALPEELDAALNPAQPIVEPDALALEFRRAFPSGSLLDLAAGVGELDRASVPASLLSELVQQITAASRQRERDARGHLPFELAVYAPSGCAGSVFVVARGTQGFAAFRTRVRAASLHASFYRESLASAV